MEVPLTGCVDYISAAAVQVVSDLIWASVLEASVKLKEQVVLRLFLAVLFASVVGILSSGIRSILC